MPATLIDILGPDGAIARRLGKAYEHRPQQLEMASAVSEALAQGHHLAAEAGTGVGKSFAYLLPAIEYAVTQKKRVVISTHTISLQEQLIEKDIPLIRAVYPEEFTAVLVKGRGNYLCQRRLEQARGRQSMLFDDARQRESLWAIEEWAGRTTDGSLTDLPTLPLPGVWNHVNAEQGNCLGKKCNFYQKCFWQAAKRRMNSGTILVVNHALFFSDLALRAAGVQYLPKYDAVIFDEAHTLEDVAGSHFGLKLSEASVGYQLRTLYDPRKGRGILSVHSSSANDAINDVMDLSNRVEDFFDRCVEWQKSHGRANGRIATPGFVENDLSPRLGELSKHIKAMLPGLKNEEELTELTSQAEKVGTMAATLDALVKQSMDGAVYWMEAPALVGRGGYGHRKITLNAAPVNVAEGLRMHLFEKVHSVVLTSATLSTGNGGTGILPVTPNKNSANSKQAMPTTDRGDDENKILDVGISTVIQTDVDATPQSQTSPGLQKRKGAYLPHWTKSGATYSVNFRLADALPLELWTAWRAERQGIVERAEQQQRGLTDVERKRLSELYSEKVERHLDAGYGQCWMNDRRIAELVAGTLKFFDAKRYDLFAWCIMPNHVHAVVRPKPGDALQKIVHSWKSFTALKANEILGREGAFWLPEYYDHWIRDEEERAHAVKYVWQNPEKAGLVDWDWRGRNDELAKWTEPIVQTEIGSEKKGGGTQSPALRVQGTEGHGQDARATAKDPFAYIRARLGLVNEKTLLVGSPFEYEKQATLYLEQGLPDPNDANRFLPAACERILHYVRKTHGGAFVLFTNYRMLAEAARRLQTAFDSLGLPLLVHGQGAPRKILLERFRSIDNAVLFGTSSFWQGIDVQGDRLRNVIITKLPFAVPDEPVIEARLDAITRAGGNPFMEYSVPEAVIKLKQGFGRLIRSKTDSGIVVILDSRVKTKRYGKVFLDALPACKTVVVRDGGFATGEGECTGT